MTYMRPRSISASSLQTAKGCMARYYAENILYTPNKQNPAAQTGTAVHGALESYVKAVYMDKTHGPDIVRLLAYYQVSYVDTFNNADYTSPEYIDGWELCEKWMKRTDLSDVEVMSCEVKSNFPLKLNKDTTVKVTYIWDRCDKVGPGEYKVVDYKSIRAYLKATDLKKKIQPRLYALSAQLQFPDAERIWVEFDLLRHEPICIMFTKAENLETWKYLKREALRIFNTPTERITETLNPECGYCVRKMDCKTLIKHTAGGGMLGKSVEEIAAKKGEVTLALKALTLLDADLDAALEEEAKQRDEIEFSVPLGDKFITVEATAKLTRKPNVDTIKNVIGDEATAEYGNITMTAIDKMLKSDQFTDEQKKEIRAAINKEYGKTSFKITMPDDLEDL